MELDGNSPLKQMDVEERLIADFHGTSMTTGPHPMLYRRAEMREQNIKSALELRGMKNGQKATVAGAVITRQRPGTAKGLIFLTLEDESAHANVIVMPDIYEKYRRTVLEPAFVRVFGTVQNQDGIVHLKAEHLEPLGTGVEIASHDFH